MACETGKKFDYYSIIISVQDYPSGKTVISFHLKGNCIEFFSLKLHSLSGIDYFPAFLIMG